MAGITMEFNRNSRNVRKWEPACAIATTVCLKLTSSGNFGGEYVCAFATFSSLKHYQTGICMCVLSQTHVNTPQTRTACALAASSCLTHSLTGVFQKLAFETLVKKGNLLVYRHKRMFETHFGRETRPQSGIVLQRNQERRRTVSGCLRVKQATLSQQTRLREKNHQTRPLAESHK